jgi:uroporphyrinogen-III synthase
MTPPADGMRSLPLAGRRIVVTRAADQAKGLADRLRALGAEPVIVPLIEIIEPSDGGSGLAAALDRLTAFDWLVVTSPNGARRVRDTISTAAPTVRFAAVGTATAEALGGAIDLVPETQTAAGLVDAFPLGAGAVLVAQAEEAQPTLVDGLRAKGWNVVVVAAYKTVPAALLPDALHAVLSADAVLFTSGSAARAWVRAFGAETPAVVAAIGPTTAQVASDLGLKVHLVATDNSLDGLVDSVARYLETD